MTAPSRAEPDAALDLDADAAAEFAALTTDRGAALLDLAARVPTPGPADLARWRRLAEPDLVAAAVRVAAARRRGAA